jgi:hypothetical protein
VEGDLMNRLLHWARARVHGDAGTTLAELIVGMALMAIFMTIFTGATLMMTNTTNKVEAVALSSGQSNQAFLTLDKMVRYAATISTPGKNTTGTNDWYVELDTTNTGSEVCTQLRVDIATKQLQDRTWTVSGTSYTTPTGWLPLASGVTNGSAAVGSTDAPFTTPAAVTGAASAYQQLQITLVTTSNSANSTTSRSSTNFTAINSAIATASTVCQQAGRP